MEATETRGLETEAPQPAAAQPEAGDSGDWLDKGPSEESQIFGDLLRSDRSSVAITTSKPADAATGGQSTPSEGDEAPTDPERDAAGRFIPRRGIPKAVAEAEAKAAAAEAKLAEMSPDKLREQVRAEIESEQQRKTETEAQARMSQEAAADAERYERLRDLPSHEMSVEDWNWVEERRALLKQYPQADAHYKAQYDRRAQELDGRHHAVMNGIASQMSATGQRLGIDTSAWQKQGVTFADMAADIEAAVRAEYRAVEMENRQLKMTGPRGLASARTGLNGGMSNGGAAPMNENDLFRRVLRG